MKTDILESVSKYVSIVAVVTVSIAVGWLVLAITLSVMSRYFWGEPILLVDEMSRYALIAIVFIGLARCQRADKHIKIRIVTQLLTKERQNQVALATKIMTVLFLGWFVWITSTYVHRLYTNEVASLTLLETPLWIPYLVVPVGFSLLTLELLLEVIRAFKGLLRREPWSSIRFYY